DLARGLELAFARPQPLGAELARRLAQQLELGIEVEIDHKRDSRAAVWRAPTIPFTRQSGACQNRADAPSGCHYVGGGRRDCHSPPRRGGHWPPAPSRTWL